MARGEVARREGRIDDLERVATRLSEQVVERERELRRLRTELASERERTAQCLESIAAVADELEALRRQARGQATRMRMRALREAADLSGRMAELARVPGGATERVLDALRESIARVGGEEAELEPEAAAQNGHADREPHELFAGLIEVEVGPLRDFAQLVGFEDAASGIRATDEVSIRGFSEGRATLAMHLSEPVALLRELEERAPFDFVVRDTRTDRVVLDVSE